jgi:hypothetical protein
MPADPTWKVLDRGRVPESGPRVTTVSYTCPRCGRDAEMPVLGRPIAQLAGGGIVFDNDGVNALPSAIECRSCRRRFEVA